MKILAIRLKNLASMEGETAIDFTNEPLCSAGIFAITGPTGAGKSTILDALCLALYARTPRYAQGKETGIELNELKQGDVRAILRNGAGDGFAEVDFVGIDGHKYRATWAVKRARNKPEGAIQNDSLKITNIDSGIVLQTLKSESCREIERLVGLSFDQFTRSVLLAQGDFTAFLKADNNDKASLLEKLTGTSIYSKISQQVFNNYKTAQSNIEQLKEKLTVVDLLTEDQIDLENQRQQELAVQLSELQKQLEQLRLDIQWQEKRTALNQQMQSAVATLDIATQRKKDAAERFNKLKLVEQVQKIRAAHQLHQSLDAQITSDIERLEETKGALVLLQSSLAEIEVSIGSLLTKRTQAVEEHRNCLPNLATAHELDVRLKEQEKNVQAFKKTLNDSIEKYKEKDQRLAAAISDLKALNDTMQNLQEWKQKNVDREPLSLNIVFITTRLEEASRQLTATSVIAAALKNKEDELAHTEQAINKLSSRIQSCGIECSKLQSEVALMQGKLQAFNVSSLEHCYQECASVLQKLIPASAAWKLFYEKRKILEETKRQLLDFREQQRIIASRLHAVEQLMPASTQKKNASDQRLARARLEVSSNVESLRNQLQHGEACPVCGSIDHPFTQHHPQVTGILQLLEKEAENDYEEWSALLNEKQALAESVKRLETDIQRLETNCINSESHVGQLESEWKNFQVQLPSQRESSITDWFASTINQCKFDQLEAKKKLDEYATCNDLLKQKELALAEIEKDRNFAESEFKIQSANLALYRTRIQEVQAEYQQKESECAQIVHGLNIYFNQASWYSNWKQDRKLFVQKLERFVHEWNGKQAELESIHRKKELVENSILQLSHQAQEQQLELEGHKHEYELSKNSYNELELSRKKLFEGRSADDVQAQLQGNIDRASMQLELAKTSRQQIAEKVAVSNSLITELSVLIEGKENAISEELKKINHWISSYNATHEHVVDHEHLKSLLSLSHEWIEEEQALLQSIELAIVEASTSVRERQTEINHHAASGRDVKELNELIPQRDLLQSEIRIVEETLMHTRFRLEADASNKKKAGKIVAEIEAASINADNWAKLNDMIGSADGKKFRQAAQEYTLDVLLVFANVQLTALNKRYEIKRIQNTLGLYVVDKDMGDEERTVVSLSGGESFLVSLALALGLASLSSSRMKVESLFIDEGFGSLDPATLNVAMDALEKLHNQGRKVGVISHVREMQERISTQIRVQKQSTGRSIVTIENGLN
ncbi:MAG TPA: AAA family ATPase [Flavitalea sp.]|nr:AAA family ATPase [Flavitalea sp.]